MQKLLTFFFAAKNINVFAVFQERNFNIKLTNNFVKFWTTGPRCVDKQADLDLCCSHLA